MLGALAKKLFGSSNDRRVKGYQPRVAAINALENEVAALSDEALKARTEEFKRELAAGKKLDDLLVPAFAKAGADIISFHPDASRHVDRTLALIRDHGCRAGLVFNPATPLAWMDHVMDRLDLVLLMSVNPGFGGQSFIPHTLEKLAQARTRIDRWRAEGGQAIDLEVDGGVKADNIADIRAAGADAFVAGSAVFGQPDYPRVIAALRDGIAQGDARRQAQR